MYSRALRNVLHSSLKLKDQKTTLIFPSFALTAQRLLNCTNNYNYCCKKRYSDDSYQKIMDRTKDPNVRTNKIDQDAREKIDVILKERPDAERLMKIIDLEVSLSREEGERVPSHLRPRDWLELLELKSASQRKKFLNYLFVNEKQNEKRLQEKEEKRLDLERFREERDKAPLSDEIVYGIGNNSILRRVLEPTMNKLWTWNSLKAIMYGNKLVFDCSYEAFMNPMEIKSCAKQIMESYSMNRHHNFPFEIFLCNANLNGILIDRVHRFIPTLFDNDFPFTVTEKSYLEIFEKSSLVYLTANAEHMLEKYDSDSVYIIGAYVDKGAKQPVSLAKAKKEGLRMAKLPLDKYIRFGDGSGKNLAVNQVCGIMLDSQIHDWKTALLHVPRRKLFENRMIALERKIGKSQFYQNMNTSRTESNEMDEEKFQKPRLFESKEVNDYSHAARSKLRERFNK